MKRVLSKIKKHVLIILTGSLLLFFVFSNALSMGSKANIGELSDSNSEAPTDEVELADFSGTEDNSTEDISSEENPGTEEQKDTIGDDENLMVDGNIQPETPNNGDELGDDSEKESTIEGEEVTESEKEEGAQEGEEGEKDKEEEEEEEEEKEKCICTALCTAEEFNQDCPVCGEDFNKCAFEEEEEKECTCSLKCEDGEVDLSCEVCSEDPTLCEGEELQYAAFIHYSLDGEEKRGKYLTLAEALEGAAEISSLVHENGDGNYTPTIEIQDELSIPSTITTENSTTYTIDMNGHRVILDSGAHIDFGSSSVTLVDSASTPINYGGDNGRPAGITGENGNLLTGTGSITFSSGYYSINNGNVIHGFSNATVNGAMLLTSSGALAEDVSNLNINGGFFVYDSVFDGEEGNLNLPGQNVLADMSLTIDGYSIPGHGLSTALFKVTLGLVGNPEYYYTTFAEAFDAAKSLSSSNDGAKATLTINDQSITNVAVSRNYALTGTLEGYSPVVELYGINLIRGGQTESSYDNTLFSVNAGELILNNCSVYGFISDSQVSVSSMITVDNGAVLTLIGTPEVGTSITGNVGLYGATAGDPCAGVYVRNGGTIGLQGYVTIANNVTYSEDVNELSEVVSTRTNKNLFLEDSARINLKGAMLRTETFLIGITTGAELTEGLSIGYLEDSYKGQLTAAGIDIVDLSCFYSDVSAAYYLIYDFETNVISLTKGSALLPEAGVLRLEFIILLIGLIGFILKNIDRFKERIEIERYISIMSVACLVVGGGLGIYHFYNENQIEAMNNEIVSMMSAQMDRENAGNEINVLDTVNVASDDESDQEVSDSQQQKESLVPEDGREYIGIIEVKELGIRLPVLKNYTDADMKTTPCVYFGTRENDNLVIVGHNYDSQFGNFNKLDSSLEVNATLTLLDGTKYYYKSKLLENLNPNQIDEMLSGEWDMTLFTCSYSGEKRIALRFDLVR